MDFRNLQPSQFEALCERLLRAEGFAVTPPEPRGRDIGVDFFASEGDGPRRVVEVKHFARARTATTYLRTAASQLCATKQLTGADGALLIVSMTLPESLKWDLAEQQGVQVLDERNLNEMLDRHPRIREEYEALAEIVTPRQSPRPVSRLDQRAEELIARLDSLSPGRDQWRDFEDLCIEILNYALFPQLGAPSIQSRSEDGLDIRDAVYPIASADGFWSEIISACGTRFMVAEFKNHSESIRQGEVESLQQYLFKKARRMFGIVCSRMRPSQSALAARRRAWIESDKLIVLCSDEELKDLVRARSYGETPTAVLDAQLQEFFLRLSP
jgi:hypothetical protein